MAWSCASSVLRCQRPGAIERQVTAEHIQPGQRSPTATLEVARARMGTPWVVEDRLSTAEETRIGAMGSP